MTVQRIAAERRDSKRARNVFAADFGVKILLRLEGVGHHIKRDGDEMTDAARQNEDVPDGVMVLQTLPSVEDNADGIGDAARDNKRNRRETERVKERLNGYHADPAHYQIRQHRTDHKAFAEDDFPQNTDRGKCPDEIKQALTDAGT